MKRIFIGQLYYTNIKAGITMTVEVCAVSFDYWTKDMAMGLLNSEERQTALSNASVYYIEIKILYLNILNIHRKKKK